ncbi:MAG TPA: biopolymer transporter ExbD [Pyrinomonadaceae bacterium]|nr:biopolymer transporter ExbD [Pyrinomonadaceae bacterium]
MSEEPKRAIAPPVINVTPLIDVLLVLLIIFMVAAPLKPARFIAKVPSPPAPQHDLKPNIWTLLVTIALDRTLKLNGLDGMGTIDDLTPLNSKLVSLFDERVRNRAFRHDMIHRTDIPDSARIEKTVFIKAPRTLPYGEVARVLDGLKGSGADPIGLQLDDLK